MSARSPLVRALESRWTIVASGLLSGRTVMQRLGSAGCECARCGSLLSGRRARIAGALLALVALAACSELRARQHAQKGNRLYGDGEYSAAISEFREAERLFPGLPVVALNLGLACRQSMVPGSRAAENERAVKCALGSFQKLGRLEPGNPRAEQLYSQVLFEADRFQELAALYEQRLRERPADLPIINSLIQVYSRWNRWEKALRWMVYRAEVLRTDPEAHYAVGAFLQNLLFQKGGGNDKSSFDPRPVPDVEKTPPLFGAGEISGEERIRLSDIGIAHLDKALEIQPEYRSAMVYLNLLYRQKSLAYFAEPEQWQALVDAAELWRGKALKAHGSNGEG